MLRFFDGQGRLLAILLATAVVAYIGWKIGQSPEQALQFAFNGLSVGAVYALLAMGFTIVYSTVWFFRPLLWRSRRYGGLRRLSTSGLRRPWGDSTRSTLPTSTPSLPRSWRGSSPGRCTPPFMVACGAATTPPPCGLGAGCYPPAPGYTPAWCSPIRPNSTLPSAPWWVCWRRWPWFGRCVGATNAFLITPARGRFLAVALVGSAALGGYCGLLLADTPGAKLYLSWAVSCLLAGAVGLALYRGLYVYMRQRARSPLIMLVASLGILLAITAFHYHSLSERAPDPFPRPSATRPGPSEGPISRGSTFSPSAWPWWGSWACCSS